MYVYIYIYLFIYIYTIHVSTTRIRFSDPSGSQYRDLMEKIAGSADDSFIYMFIQVSSRGTPAGWKFLKKKTRETQRRSRRKVNRVDF